jgi:prepilin-type N-terminal cleavage/methylation domain-containing protein
MGFTLLELLIVLIIIGFLMTAVGRTFRKVDKDVQITAALSDMKAISDAIVKGVYPDVGRIPCGGENPVFTTSCLCLECSEKDQETIQAADPINLDELSPGCRELVSLLTGEKGNIKKTKFIKKTWNKYYSKGWRGPYIEASAMIDATYFDPDLYPPDVEDNHVDLPAITTPWADKCERLAQKAEKNGDDDLAKQYRKGKYYQILQPARIRCVDRDYNGNCTNYVWEIPKRAACIVCLGADCLSRMTEDYIKNCTQNCGESSKENCERTCKQKCGELGGHTRECIEKCYIKCKDERFASCFSKCVSKLEITDPSLRDYMDIGDDIVMFVFSGGVRSPLER